MLLRIRSKEVTWRFTPSQPMRLYQGEYPQKLYEKQHVITSVSSEQITESVEKLTAATRTNLILLHNPACTEI